MTNEEIEKYVRNKAGVSEKGFIKSTLRWMKIWHYCNLGFAYQRIRQKLEKGEKAFIFWKGIKYEIKPKIDLTKHSSNEEKE